MGGVFSGRLSWSRRHQDTSSGSDLPVGVVTVMISHRAAGASCCAGADRTDAAGWLIKRLAGPEGAGSGYRSSVVRGGHRYVDRVNIAPEVIEECGGSARMVRSIFRQTRADWGLCRPSPCETGGLLRHGVSSASAAGRARCCDPAPL